MKKQIIMLFGPPGAGKGTQAELLADKLGYYYFETSRILEKEFKRVEEFSKKSPKRFVIVGQEKFDVFNEKKLWEDGVLCSPPFVTYLVKKRVQELLNEGESLILAGSPRTVYEAQEITPFLKKLYGKENIKAVLMEITPKETIFRNSNRRLCELMRHPVLYNNETKNLKNCTLDGSKLVRRKGLDDVDSIMVRLKEYKNRTLPIFDILKKQGITIKKINGGQSPSGVHKTILKYVS